MTNTIEQELLAIKADPEEVAIMLHEVAANRPEISTFLDSVGPQTALTFCAWYVGQLAAQEPSLLAAFKEALECGIQVAGVMRAQHDKENPGFELGEDLLLLYPQSPSNESQLELPSLLIQ